MIRLDHIAHFQKVGHVHAEFGELLFRLDFRFGKMATFGFGQTLCLGIARPELNGRVAILLGIARRHDLTAVKLQNRNGHMLTVL